jgi:hypothetical protein
MCGVYIEARAGRELYVPSCPCWKSFVRSSNMSVSLPIPLEVPISRGAASTSVYERIKPHTIGCRGVLLNGWQSLSLFIGTQAD